MTKLLANLDEAAQIIGTSRSSVYRLIHEKKLTPRKHGKRTLILVEELERFARSLPVMEA